MSIKKSTRAAGRPESAGMSADSIKNKINHELTKANRNAANNLGKYFAVLESYAMGKGSDTNTVSSCKFFIEMAQTYIEEQAAIQEEDADMEEVVETETKSVSNGEPVLSFADKVALHKKKQAEKKEG